MSDTPSYTELEQARAETERLHREAAEHHYAAEKKLADARDTLDQADHRLRTAQAIERSIADREQRLAQLNEAALVARASCRRKIETG